MTSQPLSPNASTGIKIFISYSRQDDDFANGLAEQLRAAGFLVSIDVLRQRQTKWSPELTSCDWFLPLLSPDSAVSDEVLKDTRDAVRGKKRILPILIRDVEIPDNFKQLIGHLPPIDMRKGIDASYDQLLAALTSTPDEKQATEAEQPASFSIEDQPVSENQTASKKPQTRRKVSSPKRQTLDDTKIIAGRARGIDVSHFDGDVDFQAVRKAGFDFVFIHTMGTSVEGDPNFARNWTLAREAGLLRGAYIVYNPELTPDRQASNFIRFLGSDQGELPPAIDLELKDEQVSHYLLEGLIQFSSGVERVNGRKPVVYTRANLLKDLLELGKASLPAIDFPKGYPLWIPLYPTTSPPIIDPGVALEGLPWTFWQYSPDGTLPGVEDKVDLNVFNGSPEELRQWAAESQAWIQEIPSPDISPPHHKILRKSISVDLQLTPSQEFIVPLILQNQGEAYWDADAQIELWVQWMRPGLTLDHQYHLPFGRVVPPGSEVPLSFTAQAPAEPGTYKTQWSVRPLNWTAQVEEPGGPHLTEVTVQAPIQNKEPTLPPVLPHVLLQSVLLTDEKVFNSQSAHFTLALFNPSGTGERTWNRNERWQVTAEFKPVDGGRLVTRQIERKFPGKVAPGMGFDFNVVVRAPNPLGDYQVTWRLEPQDWQAAFESKAEPVNVKVELYEYPEQYEGVDLIDFQFIDPPQEIIKARKYSVLVTLFNKGRSTLVSTHSLRLYLTLKRLVDDYTLGDMAALPLGVDLPPGKQHNLTFHFQAPRQEGQFAAEWELKPDESWKAQVVNPVKQTTLTLLPTPVKAKPPIPLKKPENLPPRGAAEISLPKQAQTHTQLVYENFIQPVLAQASQQPDQHRLDIHLTPRLTGDAPSAEGWKYQVVLTQYEEDHGQTQAFFYESPFELDDTAAPMEELGTLRAGKLLFDGLFSKDQIASASGEDQLLCTLDGLRRAMTLGLKDKDECLRLRVRLNNQTPAVHNYRWEYLWDPQGTEGGPLATSERLPFGRVLHLSSTTQFEPDPLSDSEPLRLLVAVASPAALAQDGALPAELAGLGPITPAEVEALVDSLKRVGPRLRFDVLWDASLDSLRQKLQDGLAGKPFQALHLLCHGVVRSVGNQACLVLQRGSTGEADLVRDQDFAGYLLPFFPGLHLVVLASCLTALSTNHLPLQGVARRLLAQTTIPAVVAMQDRLQIESAQYFAQRFYRRLVDTGEVDKAANAGRRELFDRIIRDPNHPLKGEVLPNQWGVPVLFLRVLDGRLFNVKSPTQGEFHTQARSLAELSGDDLRTVADSMLRSAASQVGLQLNLAMPNLAQSFMQAMQQARLHPEGAPTPEPRRIFGQPRQEDQRWWLVWASALYRKHPARRTIIFTRREALKKISRLLDRERLGLVTAFEFREAVQQGGGAVWIDEMTGNPLYQVGQLLGSGLANHAAWPEDDLSDPNLSHISLQDDATLQPIQVLGHLARSADWRMALRGFDSYSGADTPARIRLSGNLTWDTDHPKEYDPQAYQQLLYGENPLQAFTTLSQAGNPASSLDAESAALALHAVYPDRFLPYRESHQRQIFACLDLQNSSLYSSDYAGYCALARDLLADGDLGLDDLVDVHFFLQRLAHGDYLTPTELKQHSSGQVRPRNLRTQLRPVQIDPEQVDSDLVIRQGVLVQAAAALNAGKHIILIGPPGTGKTTLAEDLCRFAHDWDFNRGHFLVTATADWTTFDTIGGYMPESGDRLVFRPGIFLEAIASEKWLIIDEINRADIDKAFGELFTVLSGQAVTLPYKDDGRLVRILPSGQTSGEETRDYAIPKGWRIIGTMNIYDKASLFSMSYAFMRRFAFIDVPVPESRSYGRLLDYFIQHNELKDEENAGQDLRRLFLTDGIENPLMANRAVGPAIARDILDYLRSRTRNSKDAFHHGHLAEALSLYVLPQLDGLEQDNIVLVYKQLRAVFKDHAEDPVVKAMFVRIKELFPFVPQKLWGD